MTKDKLLLLKSHPCAKGLGEDALLEISDAAELMTFESGEYLHHAGDVITSIYLVVHGRLRESLLDMHDNEIMQRFLTRGSQLGILSAALGEQVPVNVVAQEPSAALRLDYGEARQLARRHDDFGLNLARLIASNVRETLFSRTHQKKPAIIALFHESPATRPLTPRLTKELLELGESPRVVSDNTDWGPIGDVPFRRFRESGEPLSREEIRRQIHAWGDDCRVFIDVDASLDPAIAAQIVELSDQVFWCLTPEQSQSAEYRLKSIESRAPGWRDKINLVWLLDADAQVAPLAPRLRELVKRDIKISFADPRANQNSALANGIARITHQLRGIRIGIALGGGAARGMAHLGVLRAIEQGGLPIDMIAGTSAGAMTGIVYASGRGVDYSIERFSQDLKPSWPFRLMPRGGQTYLLYKYRRGHFDRMLRRYLSDWTLEQLPLAVRSVTVDLVSGNQVTRKRGDAVNSILESINLPVLARPICRDGQVLVDGGLVNNIPADVLVREGCNFVIAVSVTAHLEQEFARNRPGMPTASMRSASTVQTVLRSFLVQNVNMNSIGVQPADVVIEPDVTSFDMSEFSRTSEIAASGEAATLEVLPKIKKMLSQLDGKLFA